MDVDDALMNGNSKVTDGPIDTDNGALPQRARKPRAPRNGEAKPAENGVKSPARKNGKKRQGRGSGAKRCCFR